MTEQQKARLEFAKTHKEAWPDNEIHPSAIIHPTALIGNDGFGYAREVDGTYVKMPHAGNVRIEQGVEIRAYVTVDRGVEGSTVIGEGTKVDHHCHIGHNAIVGKYNTFAAGTVIEGSCVVGDYCTFGSNVTVQRKVKVGSYVRVGSGAVITKDVPDKAVVIGNPARILRFQD